MTPSSGSGGGRAQVFQLLAEHVEGETAADKHERMALHFAQFFDSASVTRAAAHFTVAVELRARAGA